MASASLDSHVKTLRIKFIETQDLASLFFASPSKIREGQGALIPPTTDAH